MVAGIACDGVWGYPPQGKALREEMQGKPRREGAGEALRKGTGEAPEKGLQGGGPA